MFVDKLIYCFFKIFVYPSYKVKYKLPKDFRFNGYFIRIHGDGCIVVGVDSYISYFSYMNVIAGTVLTVGNNVSIAHNVKIYTSGIDSEVFVLKGMKRTTRGNVRIGNNVLIGSNVYICPGVEIGDNVIIGANSVVAKSIPSNVVAAGSPAMVLKSFDRNKNVF